MKVSLALASHNSEDWDRIEAADLDRAPVTPDADEVLGAMALGHLAEPLGFDGIWAPEHFGTPYGMSPNPLQLLAYFAGRTERISLGTMVLVLPWWNPVRLAHQIAYLDIISKGRFDMIGLGRGVAKTEFAAVGVPREESRKRFEECFDIIELALTKNRFSYEGEFFKIPEMSLRPQPLTKNLPSRFYGASSTNTSLEVMARRGLAPLFVGNKPMTEAAKDVQLVNTWRREEGLQPCQSKNILFMYCTETAAQKEKSKDYIKQANREVFLHYGFGDSSNFVGVKGYEAYAAGAGNATAATDRRADQVGSDNTYDEQNLLIGTPDEIIAKIADGQKLCSFSEIAIHTSFGGISHKEADRSLRLFAKEVIPVIHKLETPIHASALPEPALSYA
jgi:alkanesulfonate monooxygenase SsuD/methylene tetrahydromethanopterin reductase-like flavin-dependent oxidoreductase (luciferase family)